MILTLVDISKKKILILDNLLIYGIIDWENNLCQLVNVNIAESLLQS